MIDRFAQTAMLLITALACTPPAAATNLLLDGSGFETGTDGWDVLPSRDIQDPALADYRRAWGFNTAPVDTVFEGSRALALYGDPELREHEVRWPAIALEPDTDYVFSVYTKVEIEGYPGADCEPAGIYAYLQISNGSSIAISPSDIRDKETTLRSCWSRLYFHFNTADITELGEHPTGHYGFRLVINSRKRDWANEADYSIYVDAAQLEQASTPSVYSKAQPYDIGIDAWRPAQSASLAERARYTYKLFESTEAIRLRYWVAVEEGRARPRAIVARVVDVYQLNAQRRPRILIPMIRLDDPGSGVGELSLDPRALDGGSGIYRIRIVAPLEGVEEELIFGVLRPFDPAAVIDNDANPFGVQVSNCRYSHAHINEDGDPSNDRPECVGAPDGDPECTTEVLETVGPDPNETFWLLRRLGIPHMRIKQVYHPNGFAPNTDQQGTWNLTPLVWYTDAARAFDIEILAMIGDDLKHVENLSSPGLMGYPEWMSPETLGGEPGWQNFVATNATAIQKLVETVGDRIFAYEVFNEPSSLRNSIPADKLIELDQSVLDAIVAEDSSAHVLGFQMTNMGERGANWSPDFPQGRNRAIQEFIEQGGMRAMTGIAMHLPMAQRVDDHADSLYNHGLALRLIHCSRATRGELNRLVWAYDPEMFDNDYWATETNFMASSSYPKYNIPGRDEALPDGRRVDSAREAARELTQHMVTMLGAGWERIHYFVFESAAYTGVHHGVFRSLVDVYGSPRTKLMAYYALSQMLAGAEHVDFVAGAQSRVFETFRRDDKDIVVAFSVDPTIPDFPIQLPAEVRDMWGNLQAAPVFGPDPIFVTVTAGAADAIVRALQEQGAAFDAAAPTLHFDGLPHIAPMGWDLECLSQLWLAYQDDDILGREVRYLKRFDTAEDLGFVLSGEYSQTHQDNRGPVSTAVHSGETAVSGADLLSRYAVLTEQITTTVDLEQYFLIRDREGGQRGAFLVAHTDPGKDPRTFVEVFRQSWADVEERRIAVPTHTVEIAALLEEKGFVVDPAKDYLVDLVLVAIGDGSRVAVDDVFYRAAE